MKKSLFLLLALFACMAVKAQNAVKVSVKVNDVSFNMVQVQGGRFNMGGTAEQPQYEDDEFPIHVVTLPDYFIGETEVTQRLWMAVMDDNPSGFTGDLDLPVERVTWNDCQNFINKLNEATGLSFRLPTESEWEFAARGGIYSKIYQYSGSDNIDEVAWHGGNSGEQTHPVAKLKPNELGIYDMSGNVFEWCQDYYGDYDMMPQESPTGPESGETRVRRGGAYSGSTNGPRVAYRNYELDNIRFAYIGFRLAATSIPLEATGIAATKADNLASTRYTITGQPASNSYNGIIIENRQKKLTRTSSPRP